MTTNATVQLMERLDCGFAGLGQLAAFVHCNAADKGVLIAGEHGQMLAALLAHPGCVVQHVPGRPPTLGVGEAGIDFDEEVDAMLEQMLDNTEASASLNAERFVVNLADSFAAWVVAENESCAHLVPSHTVDPLSVSESLILYANVCALLASAAASGLPITVELFAPSCLVPASLGGTLVATPQQAAAL